MTMPFLGPIMHEPLPPDQAETHTQWLSLDSMAVGVWFGGTGLPIGATMSNPTQFNREVWIRIG